MRIVVAPDSFKGSLSALDAAKAVERGIKKAWNPVEVVKIPMADGGEGTVEALVTALGGRFVPVEATNPIGHKITSFYGVLSDEKTVVIEMAAASGLPLIQKADRNPLLTTSYGTGELIAHALDHGFRDIIIGIGGSATNDGGMGMLQALGVRFLDSQGQSLGFGGGELKRLESIDTRNIHPGIKDAKIQVACDVTNPLCGSNGASSVFGPQKGATPEMVGELDLALLRYAEKIHELLGIDFAVKPGAGAAGGMGTGLMAFLGAALKPGFEIVKEASRLEEHIKTSQLVITGEGMTDAQTLYGKVPSGIASLAQKYKIPVVCLSGGLGEGADKLYDKGITALLSITDKPMSLEQAMTDAPRLLESAAENAMRLFAAK